MMLLRADDVICTGSESPNLPVSVATVVCRGGNRFFQYSMAQRTHRVQPCGATRWNHDRQESGDAE
jgi:hypothetical protein